MATAQAARRPGIFYGYYMLPGLGIIMWMGFWMYLGVVGPQVTPLEREFGWSRAAIGGAYSLGAAVAGFGYPLLAWFIDRFGARRMMFVGAVGSALGHWVWAVATDLWMYYLGWLILFPFTTYITYPASTKIIGYWFLKRRGTMMSLMTVMVAFVYLGTAIIVWLIDSFGWRGAAWIMGIACVVIIVPIALFLVRERPEPRGYGPDGVPLAEVSATPQAPQPEARAAAPTQPAFTLREGLRTLPIYLFGLAGMAMAYSLVTQTTYQVPFLEGMGIPRVVAGAILGFMGLMSIPGRFGAGWLIDRWGPARARFVWSGSLMAMASGLLVLTQARDLTMVWVFLVLFGSGFGACVPTPMISIMAYYGQPSYATLFGVYMFIVRWGTMSGPVVGGYIYDVTRSFLLAFWGGAALAVIFGLALLLARPPRPKQPAAAA